MAASLAAKRPATCAARASALAESPSRTSPSRKTRRRKAAPWRSSRCAMRSRSTMSRPSPRMRVTSLFQLPRSAAISARAAAGSSNQRIAARPRAPLSRTSRAFFASMPPTATTGNPVATASARAARPRAVKSAGFRWCLEDRTEDREIGALITGETDFVRTVRGSAHQELLALSTQRPSDLRDRQAGDRQMDAVGLRCQGDVQTAVDEETPSAGRPSLARQRQKLLVGDSLAAHLQPVDSGERELRAPTLPARSGARLGATDGEQARNHRADRTCGAGRDPDRAGPRRGGEVRRRR